MFWCLLSCNFWSRTSMAMLEKNRQSMVMNFKNIPIRYRIQGTRITGMFSNSTKIYQTNSHFLTCFSDSSWINMPSKNHILWIYAMSCTQNKYIFCLLFLGNRWTKASRRKEKKKDSHHFNCQVPRRNIGEERTLVSKVWQHRCVRKGVRWEERWKTKEVREGICLSSEITLVSDVIDPLSY